MFTSCPSPDISENPQNLKKKREEKGRKILGLITWGWGKKCSANNAKSKKKYLINTNNTVHLSPPTSQINGEKKCNSVHVPVVTQIRLEWWEL